MLATFQQLHPVLQALFAALVTWLMTAAETALVFAVRWVRSAFWTACSDSPPVS